MQLHLEHDFTFLPDGRGRVAVRWTGPNDGSQDADAFARAELQRASGVDAWADVRCEVDGDRLVFSATAWFPDVTALRFHCQGFHCNLLDFAVDQDAAGVVTVRSAAEPQPMTATLPAGADRATVRRLLAQEREKLAQAREFLAGMFGGLRATAILRLPGNLAEPVRGERIADNATIVDFHGSQLLAVLDKLLTDDAALRALMTQGDTSPAAALALLGDHGPVTVRTDGPGVSLFDYDGEVAAARATWDELAAGAEPPPRLRETAPPLADVRVLASKFVREADADRELHPMGQNHTGLCWTIAGELATSALRVEEVHWDSALADDGTQLAPADEWHRRISFPKLTKDGSTLYFDVDLPLPPAGTAGLRELTGRALCLLALGEDRHELGFPELTAGAAGTVFGCQLTRCDRDDERFTLEVQFQIARERVLALLLVTDDGERELRQCGYSSCNDECTLTYDGEGELPEAARLVARVVTELQPVDVPFALPPCDWLGVPR